MTQFWKPIDFDVLTYDGLADPACYEKYLKDNKHNSLHLALKICSDNFFLDIICSSKLIVFLELRSRKTVRFSEQTMSPDKYPSIFSQGAGLNW